MKKKNFFLAHKQFTFFLILALLIILGAIFAPVVTGGADPLKGSLTEALAAPSRAHIFGTDKMGRDIFTRVIYGARASLSATFGVVALIFLVGTAAGVTAGYFGGWVDGVIMRIADMMLAFPGLVLALAVAGIMGAGSRNAIIAIVLVKQLFGSARPLVVLPGCCLGGAAFCLLCDLIARSMFAPTELSISAVTAVFGAPVVIWLLVRRGQEGVR